MKFVKGFLAALTALLLINSAEAKNFYAKCYTVSVPLKANGGGGAYVTFTMTNHPDGDGDYKDGDSSSGNVYKISGSSGSVSCYLYRPDDDEEHQFLGWNTAADGSGTAISEGTVLSRRAATYSITSTSTSSGSPAEATVYCRYHLHSAVYTANGLTITTSCGNTDGQCTGSGFVSRSATLSADNMVYNGQPYAATVTGNGASSATIKYYEGDTEISAPVNVGSYTAKMTYGDKTVESNFMITPAAIDPISLQVSEFFYTGSEQSVTLNPVTANGIAIPTEYYTVTGNTGTGDPTTDTHFTVTVTANNANVSGSQTANWIIYGHAHDFSCTSADGVLTVSCGNPNCSIPGGTTLAIACADDGKTYDGTALTATIVDNTPSPSTFESYTGGSHTELTWDDATANAGQHTASFHVTVAGQEYVVSKTFSIAKRSIAGGTVALSANSFSYDTTAKSVSVTGVTKDSFNATYEIVAADSTTSATAIGNYTVKVTGTGNFEGEATASWSIVNTTGAIKSVSAAEADIGTISGTTLTVTDGTKMETADGATWYAGITINWPDPIKHKYTGITKADGYAEYVGESDARFDCANDQVANTTGTDTYEESVISKPSFTYLKSSTWKVPVTVAAIEEAIAESKDSLEFTMNAGAIASSTWASGVAFQDYTISIPLAGITLNDQYGNQVYPAVDYVAQIGNIKYTSLAAAIAASGASDTITLIANGEAGAFTITGTRTLVLGAYGNADASYTLTKTEATDDPKVTSSVDTENVTVNDTGWELEVVGEAAPYTYQMKLAHQHDWSFVADGNTLTATCQNESCTVDGSTMTITLNATGKDYDGTPVTATLTGVDTFNTRFAEAGVTTYTMNVGDITYPGSQDNKKYTGSYTATCTITINGTEYTLTQAYAITKPAGGYNDGYECGTDEVRYDSFAEAVAAAEAGATIYYRNGDQTQNSVAFNSDKDITVDLGGAVFMASSDNDFTLGNSGSGTVTLINGGIRQSKREASITHWSTTYGDMAINGKFVFGDGIAIYQQDGENFNATVNGNLSIVGGGYQAKFGGSTVSVSGGLFLEYNKPTGYLAENRIIVPYETAFQVIEHHHNIVYSAEGNVITATCDAENHEYCGFGSQTATLTAATPMQETGYPYVGASVAYSDLFPDKELQITYWNGEDPLLGAPSNVGENYSAKITKGEVTASAPFAIRHQHNIAYSVKGQSIYGVCTVAGVCEYQTDDLYVTLVVQNATYDGNAKNATYTGNKWNTDVMGTPAIAYLTGDDTALESAPVNVGTYKAVLSVGGQSVTNEYTISKATVTGGSVTLSGTSLKYTAADQTVSVTGVKSANGVSLASGDYTADGVFTAAGSGYSNCTYTVMVNGTGDNFEGTQSVTWTITAPTGDVSGITDPTTLAWDNGKWLMKRTVTMPFENVFWTLKDYGYAQYVDIAKLHTDVVCEVEGSDAAISTVTDDATLAYAGLDYREFTYVKSADLKAYLTPAMLEGATDAEYKFTVGELAWGDSTQGDTDGIRYRDYTITVPTSNLTLDIPASQTIDIGATVLSTVAFNLASNAAVTATAAQNESQFIVDTANDYELVVTEAEGVYTYRSQLKAPQGTIYTITYTGVTGDVESGAQVGVGETTTVTLADASENAMPVFYANGEVFSGKTFALVGIDGVAESNVVFTVGDAKSVDPESPAAEAAAKASIIDSVDVEADRPAVSAKVDALTGTGAKPSEVAAWIQDKNISSADIAGSDYVVASYELGTDALITDATTKEITEFAQGEDGSFEITVTIGENDIAAAKAKAAALIQACDSVNGEYAAVDASRLTIVDGQLRIIPDPEKSSEFFKIVIPKDSAVDPAE